jgi:hypothetical protein
MSLPGAALVIYATNLSKASKRWQMERVADGKLN